MTDREDLCILYRRVLEDLMRIHSMRNYVDKRGGLTSEGRAYLATIARYMAKNRLRCIEILWELRDRLDKIESLYQCIENHIQKCPEKTRSEHRNIINIDQPKIIS
ncbi:MAG: hypothetical protein RQ885_00520 [Desulfurococcales archaeon]|nr:hypothetical protein [Desulfurococcales archaeon]